MKLNASFNFVAGIAKEEKNPGKIGNRNYGSFSLETPKDFYREVYFEALDLMIASISERFNLPSFIVYEYMKTLLIGFLKAEDISSQMKCLKENHADDIKLDYLNAQLDIFKLLMKGTKGLFTRRDLSYTILTLTYVIE